MLDNKLAAPQGFEPRYADPESAVLPLNEGAAIVLRGCTRTEALTRLYGCAIGASIVG